MKFGVLFIVFLLCMPVVLAATIHGTVYDLSLNKVDNVLIEVQGPTKQRGIAKNGTYSFELATGNYTLKADQYVNSIVTAQVEEPFQIKQDGRYRLDLILFPVLDEPIPLIPDSDLDIDPSFYEQQDDQKEVDEIVGEEDIGELSLTGKLRRQKREERIRRQIVMKNM